MESLKHLYKIGRGPSSSHTMGPDKAARLFKARYPQADKYVVYLYGSLSDTGKGHKTDVAVIEAFAPVKTDVIFAGTPSFPLPHAGHGAPSTLPHPRRAERDGRRPTAKHSRTPPPNRRSAFPHAGTVRACSDTHLSAGCASISLHRAS